MEDLFRSLFTYIVAKNNFKILRKNRIIELSAIRGKAISSNSVKFGFNNIKWIKVV